MNFLDGYTTVSFSDQTNFSLSNHIWLGIFFFLIAMYFRFESAANCGACGRLFQPLQPNLIATPSPMDRVTTGMIDCLGCLIKRILFWIFVILAIDQGIFSGIGFDQLLKGLFLLF